MDAPESPPVPQAYVLIGHYCRVLGFVAILAMIAALVRGKGLYLDLSFILLFWMGRGLLEGRKKPRITALVICILLATLAGTSLIRTWIAHEIEITTGAGPTHSKLYELLTSGMALLLLLPPISLLLRPSMLGMAPVRSDSWTPERTKAYVLGALLLGGLFGAQQLLTAKRDLSSSATGVTIGDGSWVMTVTTTAKLDDEKGTSFVSSWVIAEGNKVQMSSESGRGLTFHGKTLLPPDVAPLQYVRYLETPGENEDLPNVVIVRADGRIIPIQRRATVKTLASFQFSLKARKDIEDLQRQIEAQLPAANGHFPPRFSSGP